MQFYRKCFTRSNFMVPIIEGVPRYDKVSHELSDFIDDLYTFGFRELMGINKPMIMKLDISYYLPFIWKDEINKITTSEELEQLSETQKLPQNCFLIDLATSGSGGFNWFYQSEYWERASYAQAKLFDFRTVHKKAGHYSNIDTSNLGFWYIPLKNGFLMQSYVIQPPPSGPTAFHTDQYFFNPPLFFCNDINERLIEYPTTGVTKSSMSGTMLGLYDFTNNRMNYICFNSVGSYYNEPNPDYMILDNNYCKTIDYPNTSPAQRGTSEIMNLVDTMPFLDRELEYTNVQANNCVLIKYPYEDRFLDGIYICSTAPTAECLEGKFFSFNSRNFLGVHKNLVVELTSN